MKEKYVKPEAVAVSFALADRVANGDPGWDYEFSVFDSKLPVDESTVFE